MCTDRARYAADAYLPRCWSRTSGGGRGRSFITSPSWPVIMSDTCESRLLNRRLAAHLTPYGGLHETDVAAIGW